MSYKRYDYGNMDRDSNNVQTPPPRQHKRRSGGLYYNGWKTCPHCEAEIAKSAKYCPYCNARADSSQVIGTMFAIFIIFVLALLYLYLNGGQIRIPLGITIHGEFKLK